jgi:hypothetical protein
MTDYKEYYVVFTNDLGDKKHIFIEAHTAREALAMFIDAGEYQYKEINHIIEWVNTKIQVKHEVRNNEVVTT